MNTSFWGKLGQSSQRNRTLLCVGLDPDPTLMPLSDVLEFNRRIVEATRDLVCAYKLNLAFYEALGRLGLEALGKTLEYIPRELPVIGDGKRADVGSTAVAYARALFEVWGFDGATVNPYLGKDALEPFLAYSEKGIFVLCRTSNPGAGEFQDLELSFQGKGFRLFEWVALKASDWNRHGNLGLVVGATYPQELKRLRELCPQMPFLIPGVGAQQGDLEAAVRYGGRRAIITSSRAVLYASKDPRGFPQAARLVALELRERINRMLEREGQGWS